MRSDMDDRRDQSGVVRSPVVEITAIWAEHRAATDDLARSDEHRGRDALAALAHVERGPVRLAPGRQVVRDRALRLEEASGPGDIANIHPRDIGCSLLLQKATSLPNRWGRLGSTPARRSQGATRQRNLVTCD